MRRSNTRVSGDSAAVETNFNTDAAIKDDGVDLTVSFPDCSLYVEGEKVWALHGSQWYNAKVEKVESRMKEWTYYVHYIGWKKKWDEWMGIDRLMKFTEEDAQKQSVQCGNSAMVKNIKSGHVFRNKTKLSAAARCMKGSSETCMKGSSETSDSISEDKGMITEEKVLNIEIPRSLKKQLLDDCEYVTHLGKLVKIPRTPNVDEILKKYFAYRVKNSSMSSEAIQEILSGLRCYFDKALPAMLLYKTERKQYEEVIAENVSPSTLYGAEHLLRLFVKLPEIVHDAKIEEEALMKLQPKILDLLKFLKKNQSVFFLSTYETPENLHTNIEK